MGQRSAEETIAAIVIAFVDARTRTWSQAELARHVGITSKALGKRLEELQRRGMPLEREEDHPNVYWSAPKGWLPDAVVLAGNEVTTALRLLARMPHSAARNRLLAHIAGAAGRAPPAANTSEQSTPEAVLATIEDAAAARRTLWMRYVTATRGDITTRHASVLHVAHGPRPRFVGLCHRSGRLQWFRADRVVAASLDATEPFRSTSGEDLEAFVRTSIDGFRGATPAVRCAFVVREPEVRWVRANLPAGLEEERVSGGSRLFITTAAVELLARFVVGLGAAASVETPELAAAVLALARGALASQRVRPMPLRSTTAPRAQATSARRGR